MRIAAILLLSTSLSVASMASDAHDFSKPIWKHYSKLSCDVVWVNTCHKGECEGGKVKAPGRPLEFDFASGRVLNSRSQTFGQIVLKAWTKPKSKTDADKLMKRMQTVGDFVEHRGQSISLWSVYYKGINNRLKRKVFTAHQQTHGASISFENVALCLGAM